MADYNLGTARGKIVIETDATSIKRTKSDVESIGDEAEKSSKKVGGLKDALSTVSTSALVAGGGIAAGLAGAAAAAGEFEFQMSAIQAVSGATDAQMGALSDKALQLGKDTAFGSSQAAGAMEELAKAGIPLESIINGAADATVALAAAGQVDLAEAASITAASMNQFKLDAEDATRVADIFAGAANASATGVSQVGLAMSYVGPIANAAGLSIEDTASAVALLANNGIDSQKAGTALRAILTRLQPASDAAAAAMEELGLVTEDGTNAFYNADGSIKSMSEIVGVLNSAMGGLTEAQKVSYGQAIFGTEALSAISAIAGTTAGEFDTLSAAITGTDSADVAAKRLDNMDGQLTILKGSLETAAIILGQSLLPAITDVVQTATEWVNKFASMDASTQATIVKVAAITAGVLLLVGGLIKVTMMVVNLTKAIWTIVTAIGRAIIASAKWVAQMAVKSVAMAKDLAQTAALRAMYAKDLVVAMARATAAWVVQTAQVIAGTAAMVAQRVAMLAIRGAMAIATAAQWAWNAALTANPIGIVIAAIAALVAAVLWLWNNNEGFRNFVLAAWEAIKTAVMAVVDWFQTYVLPVLQAVWNGIVTAVQAVVGWFEEHVLPAFQAIGEFIGAVFGLLWDLVQLAWIGIMNAVQAVVDWFQTYVQPLIDAFVSAIVGFFTSLWESIKSIFTTIWDFLKNLWNTVYDFVKGVVQKLVDFAIAYFTFWYNTINTILTAIWDFISSIWNKVYDFVKGIVEKVVNWVTDSFTSMKDKATDILQGVLDAVEEKWNAVYDFITGIKDKIVGFFSDAGEWLWNAGKNIIDGLKKGLENALGGITDFFSGLTDMIPDIKGPPARDKKLLTENGQLIMQSLVDGFENGMGDVEKTLSNLTSAIPASVNADIEASYTSRALMGALAAGGNSEFNYYAAPGSGQLDGEEELFAALRRSRAVVPGWGG